jgi:hypothetical protein
MPFHFTPTSSSWLNQVERWFGLITDRMIRRRTFCSVPELEQAIYQWLATWNDKPKPLVWRYPRQSPQSPPLTPKRPLCVGSPPELNIIRNST